KPFAYGHPSIESIANRFLNGNILVIDNTPALIEDHCTDTPLDQLNPRELYEQYSHFSKLLDLFHFSCSKKIAIASSMFSPTGLAKDAPTNFPLS
ncbi:hypothetical protein Golob_027682, partial [Gossypium lobatum]|nr:hypothetical protein [Gossypium lobatum]